LATTDPIRVWDALAVSSTDTYKSRVSSPSDSGVLAYTFTKTGGAVGTLKLEVNNLEYSVYQAAVNAAAGATPTAQEAANTTGWMDCDLSPTDTFAVATTNPINEPFLLTAMGFKRLRWSYTNASGTGNITMLVTVLT
jgi:hypothetical protein